MKRFVTTLLLVSTAVVSATTAHAGAALRFGNALHAINGSITIPPEWDGVWAYDDSLYECGGAPLSQHSGEDTLCAGEVLYDDGAVPEVTFTCSGSATATTLDVTCSGSFVPIVDCTTSVTLDIEGTRTGDTSFTQTVTTWSYHGTADICGLFPDECYRTRSHATRTGPAPSDYCSTPVRRASWGQVKVRYR
jgi:hypothetical protein